MPRSKTEILENSFIGGLVTEFTPLTAPKNSVIDSLNCRFDKLGRVTRRKGLDREDGSFDLSVHRNPSFNYAYSEHIWKSSGGNGDQDFVVIQHGNILYFFDVSNTTILKGKKKSTSIDLNSYKVSGTSLNPAEWVCDYAHGGGRLIVVNKACDPIYLEFNSTLDTILATEINIKERDLKGLNDGLSLLQRPTSTVSAIKTSNPAHYYNMLNQGWFVGSYLDNWDTNRTDLPSNADFPGLYRASADDTFSASLVGLKQGASSPAPRGHFIIDSFNADRQAAMEAEGFNGATSSGSTTAISASLGDILTDFNQLTSTATVTSTTGSVIAGAAYSASLTPQTISDSAKSSDGVLTSSDTNCARTVNGLNQNLVYIWAGKDFGSNPKRISQVTVYPSSNYGFSRHEPIGTSTVGTQNISIAIHASNTAPTSTSFTGTIIGTSSASADSTSSRTITSTDTTNSYRYVWAIVTSQFSTSTGSFNHHAFISEVVFTEIFNIDQPVFDSVTNTAASGCSQKSATTVYAGKDFGTPGYRIQECKIYGSNNEGYGSGTTSVTANLRASNTLPTNFASDGQSLGLITFTPNSNESTARTLSSAVTDTFFRYVWVYFTTNNPVIRVSEITFVSTTVVIGDPGSLETETTTERPQAVCFFYSRVFWSGIETTGFNNKIYFSQIIQDDESYGKCYQVNDPASEFYFDLLPSDGGVISIPEMGTVYKLFPTRNAVIVFAKNGIWVISGSAGQPFSAVDYTIKRISDLGVTSRLSFVEVDSMPIWWAEDGISTLLYDSKYDSYDVKSITDDTIKSFILNIPSENRKYVKGCFSPQNNEITWIYNSNEELVKNQYNSSLIYNSITKGFSPHSFSTSTYSIRGIFNLFDSERTDRPVVKYVTTTAYLSDNATLGFSEEKSLIYKDWGTDNYSSYFTVANIIPNNAMTNFHPTYVLVFFDELADSSCFVQGQYDFTTTGNTGKWSTKQQAYNTSMSGRSLNYRKLKIRGKGRALKLRFNSEEGKPFSLLGWSIPITLNQEP